MERPAVETSDAAAGEAAIEAAGTPRRRGSRGGRTRRGTPSVPIGEIDEMPEAPAVEPVETVTQPDSMLDQVGPEGEALLLPNQNSLPSAARRARGRRGSGRGGMVAGTNSYGDSPPPTRPYDRPPPVDRQPMDRQPRPLNTRPPLTNRPPRQTDRPDRQDRPQGAPRRPDSPPGSVEALFARQNVLFEGFANQQEQTLREMRNVVGNLSRGGGGGAAGASVALPKVAIFLDVPNLIYAAEQVGARIHFGKLLNYLTEGRQLVRATAYAPITDDPQTRYEAQRFVYPVLNNGYKIVTKPWKRFADGSMKANFDIELAVDIITMSDRLDIVVLLSGDGDFRRVCELVETKGVRVEVVAFAASTAMELRSVADQYTDLGQIMHLVGA